MPKAKGKSSASSATRKKHAAKKGEPNDPSTSAQPKTKKGKGKNKEPKVKVYIPPPKYQPLQPDPLDTYGLVGSLPADLVVVLRRLAKKDVTTRKRALDELLEWAAKDDEESVQGLVDMVPVWYHHFPNLLSHPARQLRLSVLLVHHTFLRKPATRQALVAYLKGVVGEEDQEKILGVWCMSVADVDRQIAVAGRQCWDEAVSWSSQEASDARIKLHFTRTAYLPALSSFVEKILEDPLAMFAHLHPPSAPPSLPPSVKGSVKHALAKPKEDAVSPRAKSELDEELEDDRVGRLRSSALGALNWMLDTYPRQAEDSDLLPPLDALLGSPTFWTHLSFEKVPPWTRKHADRNFQGFGCDQIFVRRCVWFLLKTLMTKWQDAVGPYVETMSMAILRSAWVEPDSGVRAAMWEPLLSFLTKFPQAWESEARPRPAVEEDVESSDESDAEDADAVPAVPVLVPVTEDAVANGYSGVLPSEAYKEFLNFLQTACRGSPIGGYPTVLVVVSTIPASILPLDRESLLVLFRSFWEAAEEKALAPSDVLSFRAFLSSVLESLVYLSGKVWRSTLQQGDGTPEKSQTGDVSEDDVTHTRESIIYIISQQLERTSSLLLSSSALLGDQDILRTIARTFLRLTQIARSLFEAAWMPFSVKFRGSGHAVEVTKALATLWTQLRSGPCESEMRQFILEYCGSVLSSMDWHAPAEGNTPSLDMLISTLQHFGDLLSTDLPFSQSLTAVVHENLMALLSHFPPKQVADLITAYVTREAHPTDADELWRLLLHTIGTPITEETTYIGLPVLREICQSLEEGTLSVPLHPQGRELARLGDDLMAGRVTLEGNERLLGSLLRQHDRFFDQDTTYSLLSSHSTSFRQLVQDSLRKSDNSLAPLHRSLRILDGISSKAYAEYLSLFNSIGTSLFLLAFILPARSRGSANTDMHHLAHSILRRWVATCSDSRKENLLSDIEVSVRDLIADVEVQAGARDIVRAYSESMNILDGPSESSRSLRLISRTTLREEFDKLARTLFASELSATNPLVPAESPASSRPSTYDARGFSTYARLVSGLLEALTGGQTVASSSDTLWTTLHFVTFGILARDLLDEPAASNAVLAPNVDPSDLLEFLALVDKVIPYTFSVTVGELSTDWHTSCIGCLRKGGDADPPRDPLTSLICEVYLSSMKEQSVLAARALNALLAHVVRHSTAADLERWLALAQSVQDKSGLTCMAIVTALKGPLAESPRFNRYQNELASRLSGIPPSRADKDGLPLLRLLIAVAPPPDSLAPFIPQQRCIFLIQALQKWIVSEEDLDEEIDRRLEELFEYLAPIVEDIPGGHWDFIFDVLENNLELCASDGSEDWPLLYGSLRLLTTIRELASSVSGLREAWSERESRAMQLVRQIFLAEVHVKTRSKLRGLCRNLVVDLAQELPQTLVDESTMQKLYGLLYDSSVDVQKTAHRLLQRTIPKVTEQRVIEAAVNVSAADDEDSVPKPPQFNLPPELLSLLLQHADEAYDEETLDTNAFGHLLGWMTLLDFFVDASPALKTYYVEQLRGGDLLSRSLFPTILSLLPVGKDGRPLAMNLFSVEEFYVEYFDTSDPQSLSVLAAHLFYRTLSTIPSLVRAWWLDIKDRQLSSSLALFTSTHFTPILVSAELAKLRQPSAEEELAHESLSIKIASNVSEVTVAYEVDEQQMELGIRLPPDFPLHGVEVRDVKRVGVPLDKWRQWMLQVQQTITSQNGFLLDALVLFKKNVTLYFEGVVECAICYSVISTTDRSLPTKPCKTCKNLFHNSCLYKWFNTSNQSSCPLCRSQF